MLLSDRPRRLCTRGRRAAAATSQTGASPSEVASYVPAGSPFYLEATTDFDGPQWTQVDALAKLFPAYPELRAELDDSLRSDKVNFETDVKPLLGARAAIAGPRAPGHGGPPGDPHVARRRRRGGAAAATAAADDTQFVGVVEIADGKSDGVEALLVKGGATKAGQHDGRGLLHRRRRHGRGRDRRTPWCVSDTQQQLFAALDAHRPAATRRSPAPPASPTPSASCRPTSSARPTSTSARPCQQAGASSPQLEPARPVRLPERRHRGVDRRGARRRPR